MSSQDRDSEEDAQIDDIPDIDDDEGGKNSESPPLESKVSEKKSKKLELGPGDFFFGSTLGEGAYARVVHARMKCTPKDGNIDFAIKIMEKGHIRKENKVIIKH